MVSLAWTPKFQPKLAFQLAFYSQKNQKKIVAQEEHDNDEICLDIF